MKKKEKKKEANKDVFQVWVLYFKNQRKPEGLQN